MEGFSADYSEFLNPGRSQIFSFLLYVILGGVFLKHPMLAISFICVQPYFLWGVGTNFGVSFYLAYLAVAIIVWKYRKRIYSRQAPSYGPILLFSMILVLWSIISPLLYPVRDGMFCGYSLSRVNLVGSLLPMLLLPRILRNKTDVVDFIRSSIGLLAVLNCIVFLCCLVLLATDRSFSLLTTTNILGVMPHSWEAALLLIGLAFAHAMGWMSSRRLIPLVLLAMFCLVVADSRTKVFAALVCTAYIVLPYLGRFVFPTIMLSFVLYVGYLVAPPNIIEVGLENIEKRILQTKSDDIVERTSGRSVLYAQAYESFLTSPWVGVGEGYAITPILRYGKLARPSPHSFYIGVLAHQGLIGAGILLIVIVLAMRLMWKTRQVCSVSYRDAIIARFLNALLFYGLFCMGLKASWGTTFWALALLQVFYNVSTQKHNISSDDSQQYDVERTILLV